MLTQAILRLPTVQGSKGWRKDGDQERESDPWSQLVDAEAFLEALLLLVLEAKVPLRLDTVLVTLLELPAA